MYHSNLIILYFRQKMKSPLYRATGGSILAQLSLILKSESPVSGLS